MAREKVPEPVRRAFGKELKRRRLAKHWSQSDLARRAWGKEGDARRGMISDYEAGRVYPGEQFLEELATALQCKSSDLTIRMAGAESEFAEDRHRFEDAGPDKMHVYINQTIPRDLALKIINLVPPVRHKR